MLARKILLWYSFLVMANITLNWLKEKILISILSILTFSFMLFTFYIDLSAQDKVLKIQKTYDGISDISGRFIQKSFIKDLNRTDTFNGQFFIKMPMKLKWSYKDPPQEIFVNNNEIIIYQKNEKQVLKGKFDKEVYGQAPIALLSGFGKIQEEFFVSEKDNKLILKPKKSLGNIVSIEVICHESVFPISSFIIYDLFSNKIEIILKDVKINTGLKDTLFEFLIPKGINIFEYNP